MRVGGKKSGLGWIDWEVVCMGGVNMRDVPVLFGIFRRGFGLLARHFAVDVSTIVDVGKATPPGSLPTVGGIWSSLDCNCDH